MLLSHGFVLLSFSNEDFKNLIEMYLNWGIITIPVTIYLLYEFCKEVYDFLFNRRKVLKLLNQVDKISIDKLENEIDSCLKEMKTMQERFKSEENIEMKNYWKKNWNYGKSERENYREQKLRTLFNPNK